MRSHVLTDCSLSLALLRNSTVHLFANKALIKRKQKDFSQSLPELMQSNTKKFWSVFKSISKTSNVPSIMSRSLDETTVTADINPDEIANLLNNYFYSMLKTPLSQEEYDDHLANNVDFIETISDSDIAPNEVRYVLLSLDMSKATGPDNIPAALLIYCAPYISSSLSNLFNKSLKLGKYLQHGKFPTLYPSRKVVHLKE